MDPISPGMKNYRPNHRIMPEVVNTIPIHSSVLRGVTWSPPLLLESGNRSNEDDTKTGQAEDKGLSRKRQSLRRNPGVKMGRRKRMARRGTTGGQ
jgi:hypothetical protein